MNIFIFVPLVGFLIFNIVNNTNILTDGRRYRRRPRIEIKKMLYILLNNTILMIVLSLSS